MARKPTPTRPRRPAAAGADPGAEAAGQLEARLRALLAEGDLRQAATEIIRGYGPQLLRYLRGLLGNESDAREAFALASERLWRSLPGYRGEAAMRTWCFHLAWSAAADLRKEAWRTLGRRLETEEAGGLGAGDRTPSWLRQERLRLSLEELRRALTLEEQSLLQLRIDQGLSFAECAEVLAEDGKAPTADALMKRFDRIKARLMALADVRKGD
jgi:RNA polymerase sigma-70 factor (ECF subfamily)